MILNGLKLQTNEKTSGISVSSFRKAILSSLKNIDKNDIEKILHTSNLNINDNIKENIQLQANTLDHVFNNIENINNINYNILQSELDKTLFNIETASSKLISSINIKSTKKKYLVINILILILSFIVFYIFYF